jgi:murein L,D-transpeptidase YcbB/YkuD
MTIVAIATMLATASASGQSAGVAGTAPLPAKPVTAAPAGAANPVAHAIKPAAASTPESRSAAALALSHEPTFDEGTAQRIKEAALSYSDLAVRGGWPMIPADAKFTIGVQGPQDDLLRQRLLISGDLAADQASGPFDEVVAESVMRFQARHGLAPTGTVTPRTLAALNVPVQKRVKQLEASLERLENMSFTFGQRYVVVNLPAAFAEAVENDKVVRRYRVIVGKTEKPSPTLTAEITSVNLNPTWTVPSSIAKTEISAHMRKDPGYLSRMHMEVLDAHDAPIDPRSVDWSGARTPNFTVRQQSGTWNALGAVKIDMPNWNRAAIDAAIATGQREDIALPRKVPVAWIYLTAWMTKDQTVQFRNDIYDQDEQLLEATAEEAAFFSKAGSHPLTAHLAQ